LPCSRRIRLPIGGLRGMPHATSYLYETMLRDTYQNGVVLARRKYRYLAYAYRLFVVGLTLTFIAFAVEMAGMWRG
uniref:Pycsar system effector family protein n=1 Tax=Sphingopyxis sp. TaxID=1908224 RepID=UPI0040375AA8